MEVLTPISYEAIHSAAAAQKGVSSHKKPDDIHAYAIERRRSEDTGPYEALELARQVPLPPSSSTVFTARLGESDDKSFATNGSTERNRNESSLAPVDGGIGAWSFLLAAFLVETIVWGFPDAYGVLLEAYLKDSALTSQPNAQILLPMIGTLTSGIIYFSAPGLHHLVSRYPNYRRGSMWVGAVICWASLFSASYTSKVTNLVLCEGVLYAIGGALLYNPCTYYTSEWFVARRGLANGVIFAGTAVGGVIFPLVLPGLLERFGTSVTLRILAVAFAAMLLPILPFIRGRLPQTKVKGPISRSTGTAAEVAEKRAWMKSSTFRFLMLANTLQAFGYFVPIVWLPTFASELNLSASNSSLTLALLNGASLFSRLASGILSDIMDPWVLALCTLMGTCLTIFFLWGLLGSSLTGLVAFGLVYGSFAGGWACMWPGFIRQLAKDDPQLFATFSGYLMLSRGIGNVLSTPISTAISTPGTKLTSGSKLGFNVGGGRFENVIIYAGTCFAGAVLISGMGWGWDKRRSSRRPE